MRKLALAVFAVAPLLFGCAGPNTPAAPIFARDVTFVVNAIEGDTANVYLSSKREVDDPQAITLAIQRSMLKSLRARYGENLKTAFLGKTVHVQGTVFRSRVVEPSTDHSTGPVILHELVVAWNPDKIELI